MNKAGSTVSLYVCPEALFRRLKVAKAKRPLLADKSEGELMGTIVSALEKRMPYYSQARYRFNAERLESHSQIDSSVTQLENLLDMNKT